MKIVIHGFGAFPLFFYPMIEIAKKNNPEVEWSMVLPTSNYVSRMVNLLGKERVLYLFDEIRQGNFPSDSRILESYHGSFFRDIAADKSILKFYNAVDQVEFCTKVYMIYKKFLIDQKATHLLFPHVESAEGMILGSVAKELGLETIYYAHTRNLGESFFSPNVYEMLPPYAEVLDKGISKAQSFIQSFQEKHIKSESLSDQEQADYIHAPEDSAWIRYTRYLKQIQYEKENQSLARFRARIMNNVPVVRDLIWKTRRHLNKKQYDIASVEELPEQYIFYPLQYSPESSINTPAPYYVDQSRVIDLLRFHMPSHMTLVVKEHPTCITIRPGKFIKQLRKSAGVRVAKYDLNTRELINKAALTVSVTGTATLEAFLLGKPSIVLGDSFFSDFIGGRTGLDELNLSIRQKLDSQVSDEDILQSIARTYSISKPFVLRSPNSGIIGDMTMTRGNIETFLEELLLHISKMNLFYSTERA